MKGMTPLQLLSQSRHAVDNAISEGIEKRSTKHNLHVECILIEERKSRPDPAPYYVAYNCHIRYCINLEYLA